eukprot:2422949-Pyramimonas_sp.AAC.1
MQCCSLLGGHHTASGQVDQSTHLSNKLMENYLTGRVPVGAGCSCALSATQVSHSAPDSNPHKTKDKNTNPMAP